MTAANIAELGEQTLVEADHCIALRFATQKHLLQTKRQTRERIDWAQTQRFIEFCPGDEAVVAGDEAKRRVTAPGS